jgi:hypothetical protein
MPRVLPDITGRMKVNMEVISNEKHNWKHPSTELRNCVLHFSHSRDHISLQTDDDTINKMSLVKRKNKEASTGQCKCSLGPCSSIYCIHYFKSVVPCSVSGLNLGMQLFSKN